MTVFLTVFSGVMTFVLGQLVIKLLVDPVHDFRKTVADIALALIEYANVYANPGVAGSEIEKKVSEELRRLSSRLNAQMYLIPYYRITAKIFGLPSRERVVDAASNLIGLSNGVFRSASDLALVNVERADKIRDILGIFVPESERIKPRE
ncbi:hypothetical protein BST81_11875 [Leptolyngbya sp. 'hensonii']|uniref:hypothetical protein n=1 Tax=Leptolyngbya sp. 'hensonii' TaxID=1922337 RepID=UPI00094FB2B0|nr:hypothetical protein [Leptolyngbya sp. 'hensonii']OLP18218.1 hypothetical protein BST81_11875 [Leptolyngbya sp. 'hensonii']